MKNLLSGLLSKSAMANVDEAGRRQNDLTLFTGGL